MKTAMLCAVIVTVACAIGCAEETAGTAKAGEAQAAESDTAQQRIDEALKNPDGKTTCGKVWSGRPDQFGGSTTDFSVRGLDRAGALEKGCATVIFNARGNDEVVMMVIVKYAKGNLSIHFEGKPQLGVAYPVTADPRFYAVYTYNRYPHALDSGSITFSKYPKGMTGALEFAWEGVMGYATEAQFPVSGALRAAP